MLKRYLFVLLWFPLVVNAGADPRTKTITLSEFTKLTLDVVPDLGTRFVFPFVLDEQSDYVPFTLKLTNPVFVSTREEGRHFFVITLPSPLEGGKMPKYLGNLFVNVAGYNISVLLRSTNKTSQHYSDVVFELSDNDRQTLIQDAVDEQMIAVKAEYQQKENELDKRAHAIALKQLGGLVLDGGDTERVAEDKAFELNDGSQAILEVDKLHKYADFGIFTYELVFDGNTHQALNILDVQLFGKKEQDEVEELIPSVYAMRRRLNSGDSSKGYITSDSPNLMAYQSFQIAVSTSLGNLVMNW